MQQVGVGEHDVGVLADPVALLARGVAVVDGGAYAGQIQRGEGAQLVGGERLGRREVEDPGLGAAVSTAVRAGSW